MQQFDVVRVAAIRDDRFVGEVHFDKRSPVVGDVGMILEVYADAYEVECSDSDGTTLWLAAMYSDELPPGKY
jgi:hypothetical protein